ncbi:hypothetical protein ASF47_18250 [Nocardioides sp. Leaf285]|nr:hypothetical protein ASF47_18250 [Nocardioides sp. Leaf285]
MGARLRAPIRPGDAWAPSRLHWAFASPAMRAFWSAPSYALLRSDVDEEHTPALAHGTFRDRDEAEQAKEEITSGDPSVEVVVLALLTPEAIAEHGVVLDERTAPAEGMPIYINGQGETAQAIVAFHRRFSARVGLRFGIVPPDGWKRA